MTSFTDMDASACIEQKGIVEEINHHRVKVRIQPEAACGGCHAKGLCSVFGSVDRIIEVYDQSQPLSPGDPVNIAISRGMGNKAVFLGYLVPFLLFIAVLILTTSMGVREWVSGVSSLASLIPYYIILYLFRDRLNRTITFTLKYNA